MLSFELSKPGRTAAAQIPAAIDVPADLPEQFRHTTPIGLSEVSELQALRHHTSFSRNLASANSQTMKCAPVAPLRRPDAVKAALELDIAWRDPGAAQAAA